MTRVWREPFHVYVLPTYVSVASGDGGHLIRFARQIGPSRTREPRGRREQSITRDSVFNLVRRDCVLYIGYTNGFVCNACKSCAAKVCTVRFSRNFPGGRTSPI